MFLNTSKLSKLDATLKAAGKSVIAFSGGVDSSYLLYRASQVVGDDIIAVTVRTPYMSAHETEEATDFTTKYKIKHQIVDIPIPEIIRYNPTDRCYFCKKTLFGHIIKFARENGYKNVIDGTNADDLNEYRPGIKAIQELKVISPLAEAGLTKQEIRKLAQKVNLSLWSKPSMSCLLTRIPHETEITDKILRMIEKAEEVLFNFGYPGTRVRIHGSIARIECLPGFINKIATDPNRDEIVDKIKQAGFTIVTLDLEGYRSGNMDRLL